MVRAFVYLFLIISVFSSVIAFYGHKERSAAKISLSVLGVLYILTHLLIVGFSLSFTADPLTGNVLYGFGDLLAHLSISTIILFYLFEISAFIYTVIYIVYVKKEKSIRKFSVITATIAIAVGISYTLVLWFFAAEYIDWTCALTFIPYFIYAAMLFLVSRLNTKSLAKKAEANKPTAREKNKKR